MANITPSPNSISGSAGVNSGSSAPVLVTANVQPNQEFQVTIVTGSAPSNSGTNTLIIPSLVPGIVESKLGCYAPDQNGTVISSGVSAGTTAGLAQLWTYFNLSGMTIAYIRINTTAPNTLFNNYLYYGLMPYIGTTSPAYWALSLYAITGPAGYNNTLVINTDPAGNPLNLPVVAGTYMYFNSLPASATTNLSFGVSGVNNSNVNS